MSIALSAAATCVNATPGRRASSVPRRTRDRQRGYDNDREGQARAFRLASAARKAEVRSSSDDISSALDLYASAIEDEKAKAKAIKRDLEREKQEARQQVSRERSRREVLTPAAHGLVASRLARARAASKRLLFTPSAFDDTLGVEDPEMNPDHREATSSPRAAQPAREARQVGTPSDAIAQAGAADGLPPEDQRDLLEAAAGLSYLESTVAAMQSWPGHGPGHVPGPAQAKPLTVEPPQSARSDRASLRLPPNTPRAPPEHPQSTPSLARVPSGGLQICASDGLRARGTELGVRTSVRMDGGPHGDDADGRHEPPTRTIELCFVQLTQLSAVDLVQQTFSAQLFLSMRFPGGALDPTLANPSPELPKGADGRPLPRPSAAWFAEQIDFNNATNFSVRHRQIVKHGDDLVLHLQCEGTFMEVRLRAACDCV